MNGMSIAEARRAGMVEEEYDSTPLPQLASKRNNMFVGDDDDEDEAQDEQQEHTNAQQFPASAFNPAAAVFSPGSAFALNPSVDRQPKWMTSFGKPEDRSPDSAGGPPKGLFGPKTAQQEQPATAPSASSRSPFTTGLGTTNTPFNQPSSASATPAPAPATLSGLSGFTSGQPSAQPSLLSGIFAAAPDEQEKVPEPTTQPASRTSIFDPSPQYKTTDLGVPKTTPTFSWGLTPGTKPDAEPLKPSQPVFNFTPSSSSASVPSKFHM